MDPGIKRNDESERENDQANAKRNPASTSQVSKTLLPCGKGARGGLRNRHRRMCHEEARQIDFTEVRFPGFPSAEEGPHPSWIADTILATRPGAHLRFCRRIFSSRRKKIPFRAQQPQQQQQHDWVTTPLGARGSSNNNNNLGG